MTALLDAMAMQRASPTGKQGANCARLANINPKLDKPVVQRVSLASMLEIRAGPLA